ncbi:hypothetical protein ACV8UU_23810, partial [Citrobacter freundii]
MMDARKLLINLLYRATSQSSELPGWSHRETKKVWSVEGEAEWLANLLSDTATEEDAREEYYCEPKNGGGVY